MDDLVNRLRSKIFWHTEAAVWMLEAADRIEELEAKLAKAVGELENMQKVPRSDASYGILMVMIKYTLAELKGL